MKMAKLDLTYVQAFRDRHGHLRHYYRRAGFARLRLPGPVGSAEFMAAYVEAEARAPRPVLGPASRLQPRSINALIVEYYRSPEFLALRDSTRRAYRGQLDRFRKDYGDRGALSLQPRHLEGIFHKMADRPEATANLRKRLRRVFRLAVRLGWRNDNPVVETERPRGKRAGIAGWSDDDIAAFEARWPEGSRERLALALMLYTGQRRSDVIGMGRQHVSGGRVSVVQLKTGHRLKIRLHPLLAAEIARHAPGMTFLTTAAGAPMTVEGFGNWFRDASRAAGLVNRTPHGLRKAAGRRLAEAGCSAKEIAAVLGHTTLGEVARYTRDADQTLLSDAAFDRLEKAETRTAGVNPG